MSNLDRDREYNDLTTLFRHVLMQWCKGLNTCLPGVVEEYDAPSRRARVQPALQIRKTDESLETRAPLVNVPVVFPSGGEYTQLFPLVMGDPVILLFSQQGYAEFKLTRSVSPPTAGRRFSASDAICVPGFGVEEVTPAEDDAALIQTNDGTVAFILKQDSIELRVPTGDKVYLGGQGGMRVVLRDFLTLFNTHTHPTPTGPSGPPVQLAQPVSSQRENGG